MKDRDTLLLLLLSIVLILINITVYQWQKDFIENYKQSTIIINGGQNEKS